MLFDSMPSKKSAAWKQAEINLDRRVKEENRLRHQREVEKRFKDFAFLSNWQDNVALIAWKSDVKRIQDGTKEDIYHANRKLLQNRRARLNTLLVHDLERFNNELTELGLAIYHDRI